MGGWEKGEGRRGGASGWLSSINVQYVWWLVDVLLRMVELLVGHDGLLVLILEETEVLSSPIQVLPWLP